MTIDDHVEKMVREALAAAVKRDLDRLGRAIAAFDGNLAAGLQLTLAVCLYVMVDIHGGARPTTEQIRAVAEDTCEFQEWARLDVDEVSIFLENLFDGRPLHQILPADEAVVMPFVVTATLLASFSEPVDGRRWFDYLDTIENTLERAQD